MKRRVVIIRSNQVAPDSRVEKEATALVENGYDVTILAWDRRSNHPKVNEQIDVFGYKIPIVRFGHKAEFGAGMKSLKSFSAFQYDILKWLVNNRKHYDIIHACDFDTAFTSTIANFIVRKKLVFDIFDYIAGERKTCKQKLLCKLQTMIINKADATIICTEQREKQIYPAKPKRLTVIHNVPPKSDTDSSYIAPHNPVRICYVGILQDYRMLETIPNFFINNPDFELHIGGFGKLEPLYENLSSKYSNINYYGRLQYAQTLELEKECDIMLAIYDPKIENHIYAAPNKFYEGLMLGKPLIMVKGTGMSQIVEEYKIGETIDYSIEGFKQGILSLVSREQEWHNIHERMKDLYQTYSWDKMKVRLINLYNSL